MTTHLHLTKTLGPNGSIRFMDHHAVVAAWNSESGAMMFYPHGLENGAVRAGTYRAEDLTKAEIIVTRLWNMAQAGQVAKRAKF